MPHGFSQGKKKLLIITIIEGSPSYLGGRQGRRKAILLIGMWESLPHLLVDIGGNLHNNCVLILEAFLGFRVTNMRVAGVAI